MTVECPLSADDAFGPAVRGCRNNFDFTLLFEQSFFQLAPCALLLILFPLRASQLHRQDVKTLRTGMQTIKLTAITVLACTQLALIVLWSIAPLHRTTASILAATLSFLASIALLFLSHMEHTRSIRPSSVINVYILFSLLFDIPQTRTLWLRPGPQSVPVIFTIGVSTKAVILYLEARSKRRSLFAPYRVYAPEMLVSLYDRAVLWWLNPLFVQGYHSLISFEKVYRIDTDLSSESVEANFQRVWIGRQSRGGKRPLLWAMVVILRWNFVALMVPRLCLSALKLSQPLLINRVTSLLSDPMTEESMDAGQAIIGGTVLLYLGLAITTALYKRQMHRLLTKIRGMIVTAVHAKILDLPSDMLSDNAALSLITADLNRIVFSLQRFDDFFATPIEIGVAIFLLQRQIGVSCAAPVALAIGISIVSFFNFNAAIPMQKTWLASVQERVAYTAAVLECPKGFKMLGLTDYLADRIQALRVKELADYAQYRKYVTHRNGLSFMPKGLAPPIALITFTLVNGDSALNPTIAFTALSLVALLTDPIHELIHAVPSLQTAIASLDRIQAFLMLDSNVITGPQNRNKQSTSNVQADDAVELEELPTSIGNTYNDSNETFRIENGNVRVGKEQKLVLQDINIALVRGTLNLVIGPVGSGKSTLLKTILGDTNLGNGKRAEGLMSANYAYCAQDPWLPNSTVRNLVVCHSEVDLAWYSTIIHACALDADIGAFPQGDDTIIGTKGVSLSGGQRQRLALARALYSRKQILVIDDILSGLDANTSQAIFVRVLGSYGLCKEYAVTVVFATHALQYLQAADHIIALEENGKIVEQGSFEELNKQTGYINNLSLRGLQAAPSQEKQDQALTQPTPTPDKLEAAQQNLARRTGDISIYRYYAKSIGWWYGSMLVITAVGFAVGVVFPDLWVRWWSEAESTSSAQHPLGLWIGIYLLFSALGVACVFSHIWIMLVNTVPKSSAQLHKQLLEAVMRAPYSFFVNTDSGVTLNRFSSDMSLIEGELAGAVMQTLDGVCICIFSAALIAAGAKFAGLAMPFVLVTLYVIQKFYLRTSRQLRFMDLEALAPLLTHCSETISGVTTLRAFGWQSQSHQRCLDLLDSSQRPYYLMLCIQRWLNLVLDLTTAAIATIVVAMAMTLPSTSSAGLVGLSMLNILSFNAQLSYLIAAWTTLETALGAVARCRNLAIGTKPEDLASENFVPPPNWPQAGRLTLSNVSASYNEDGEDALKTISISAAPGEKIGICGRTGSGKSSLLLTILRLLDNKSGSIDLDDINLSNVPRQTVRERLTALPQEAIIVPGSLKDNIDPLDTSTDTIITAVLEKVGLLEVTVRCGGLRANLKDLGLSQGQMQLFAVARALLQKSKLLLVDEMTSSVDAVTEEKILSLVQEEFADSTVVAIAHRLKTIVSFDKIIVMDRGCIVEMGAPSELLALQSGYFRSMWERTGH